MSTRWIEAVVRAAAVSPVVRAVVIEAKGSTPREVGAWMLITGEGIEGTIGGGALEHACIERARSMLDASDITPWLRTVERFHLGPELNQCCGGAVVILLEVFGAMEAATLAATPANEAAGRPLLSGVPIRFEAQTEAGLHARIEEGWWAEPVADQRVPLFVYGGGHVGRAVVRALDALPFAITWYDGGREGEPARLKRLTMGPGFRRDDEGSDVRGVAREAPQQAFHLVMTHSHALDEAIVAAILETDWFGYLGLIGSATKRARFRHRLMRAGMAETAVERIHCPIGLPGLVGKAPAVIAASVAADLLLRRQKQIDQGAVVQ